MSQFWLGCAFVGISALICIIILVVRSRRQRPSAKACDCTPIQIVPDDIYDAFRAEPKLIDTYLQRFFLENPSASSRRIAGFLLRLTTAENEGVAMLMNAAAFFLIRGSREQFLRDFFPQFLQQIAHQDEGLLEQLNNRMKEALATETERRRLEEYLRQQTMHECE